MVEKETAFKIGIESEPHTSDEVEFIYGRDGREVPDDVRVEDVDESGAREEEDRRV